MSFYYCLSKDWKVIHSRRRVNDSLQSDIAAALPKVLEYDCAKGLESHALREAIAKVLPPRAREKAMKHGKPIAAEVSKSLTNFVREGWLARGTPGVGR
jgi:hypothetical protein